MGLETATFISGLVETNPVGTSDFVSQGDNHLRLIKSTIKNTFPDIAGAVNRTAAELNDAPTKSSSDTVSGQWTFTGAPTFNAPVLFEQETVFTQTGTSPPAISIQGANPTFEWADTDNALSVRSRHNGVNFFLETGNGTNFLRGEQNFSENTVLLDMLPSDGELRYRGIEVGYRDAVRTTSLERGKVQAVTSGFTLGTQSPGATYGVYNDSASSITITQGAGLTLRLSGTSTTGNRTLAARTLAAIWYNANGEAVISGLGVT